MELLNITKVREGEDAYNAYMVESKPCPKCSQVLEVKLLASLLFKYNQGASITEVFPGMGADDRERFISGYCGPCWTATFGDDNEDEEGDD